VVYGIGGRGSAEVRGKIMEVIEGPEGVVGRVVEKVFSPSQSSKNF